MKLRTLPFLLATSILSPFASAASSTLDLYAWPLSSSKPAHLALITYDAATLAASVSKYTLPKSSSNPPYSSDLQDRVRVGFYDKSTSTWTGIVTDAASFDPSLQQRIQLHVSADGEAYHVTFGAVQKVHEAPMAAGAGKTKTPARQDSDEQVVVELITPGLPPSPVLNKPIVLDPTGKVAGAPEEKTFLQKYWWAIAGFLILQVLMSGAKE